MDDASQWNEVTDGTVSLRPSIAADWQTLIAGRDAEFHRFMGDGSPEPDPTAVVLNTAGEVVGWVDFDTDRAWLASTEANLGYNTFAEHRGRGYATRAVTLLLTLLAENSELTTATLLIDPANAPSIALARRIGFTQHDDVDGELFFKRELIRPSTAAS